MTPVGIVLATILAIVAFVAAIYVVVALVVPLIRGIFRLIAHVFRFISGEISDALRIVGSVIASLVFVPLVILNIIFGRWSRVAHFGRAVQGELRAMGAGAYRLLVGHPARLLGMSSLTEGIERRVPEAMAGAPGRDRPKGRTGQFPGYTIISSLAGGGSGGQLYVARAEAMKRAALERSGHPGVDQVVIKVFSLRDGSSLPQIVRESRALDAARKMGLVLEHELTDERFFYVMRYVPGESLGLVTQRMHAICGPEGLDARRMAEAMAYGADLVRTLEGYHAGGLWHKDVKPDNIIVDGKCARLVDLGLITPLASSMTLTTHGTEYFRDPELVRMALRGVKVHQVDGAKFDVYGAGAVLYSVIENSFPAHAGLSQITKRCPEALKWVIRRAMTDYDKRYASASEMLADLHVVMSAADPYAVRPGDLPSMRGAENVAHLPVQEPAEAVAYAGPVGASVYAAPEVAPAPRRARPNLHVASWWTGRYDVAGDDIGMGAYASAAVRRTPRPSAPLFAGAVRHSAPAREQVARARARAHAAQARARTRMASLRAAQAHSGINAGVAVALFIFVAGCVGLAALVMHGNVRAQARVDGLSGGASATFAMDTTPAKPLSGRVLVLKEGDFSDAGNAAARAIVTSLQRRGASVFGALADVPTDTASYTQVVDAMARADLVRDLAPIGSMQAEERLTAWLAESDVADVLLWVHQSGDPDRPSYWVVPRPHASDHDGPLDRLVEALPPW